MIGIILIFTVLAAIGFIFVFFPGQVREYHFREFKNGVDKYGFLRSWIAVYPGKGYFRAFGFVICMFAVLVLFSPYLKDQ